MILLMMVDTPEEKRKFVILYENYRYLMLKVAADILHDYQLAEDAVQEAFVRVAKHMENVGQPEETATKRYLITITKHAAIDLYRRRNRLQSREIYMDEGTIRQRISRGKRLIEKELEKIKKGDTE